MKLFPCFLLDIAGYCCILLASLISSPAPMPRVVGRRRPTASMKHDTLASCHPITSCALANPIHQSCLWHNNKTRMSPLSAQHPFFTPIFQPKDLTFLPNRDPLSPLSSSRGLFFVALPKTSSTVPHRTAHQYPIRPWFINLSQGSTVATPLRRQRNCIQFSSVQLRNQSHCCSVSPSVLPQDS